MTKKPEKLITDRAEALVAVQEADREIVSEAVSEDGIVLEYASAELRADPELIALSERD